MSEPVIVVGAGLAGLVCARRLLKSGRDVLVLESDSRPGGRLKTDEVAGFRLDRGFQVFFTSYPNLSAEVAGPALDPRALESGALIYDGERLHEFTSEDPFSMAFSQVMTASDKLRLLALSQELPRLSPHDIETSAEVPATEYLARLGFSQRFLDLFARPFFGSLFLDSTLSVSSHRLIEVWRLLFLGKAAIPALGMEAIPRQIAGHFPGGTLRTGCQVDEILSADGRARGVRLASGEQIAASEVVLACSAPEATRLSRVPTPHQAHGCTTVYFDAPRRPTERPALILNASGLGRVAHLAVMSNVSRDLAPTGRHLIQATMLGVPSLDDRRLAGEIRYELGQWGPIGATDDWRPLRVYRVPFAQFAQPPGFRKSLPGQRTEIEGLWLAGEFTRESSIDGAVASGVACAAEIVRGSSA